MTQSPIEQAIEALHDVVNGNICTVACLDALEALRQHQQDGGWLPIKSAPRDGTRFICCYEYRGERFVYSVYWSDEENDWLEDGAHAPFLKTVKFAYWQPLPPAPKKENDDG